MRRTSHTTVTEGIEQLRHRRRVWAWTGWGCLAGSVGALSVLGALRTGTAATVLAFVWLIISALAVTGLVIAAVDTIGLHSAVKVQRATGPGPSQAASMPTPARRRLATLSGVKWALEAVRMVLMLVFVAYFVSVQVEAIAYLAGKHRAGSWGSSAPIPIDGVARAIGDILVGLFWEIIFGLIFLIAGVLIHAESQERRAASRTNLERS